MADLTSRQKSSQRVASINSSLLELAKKSGDQDIVKSLQSNVITPDDFNSLYTSTTASGLPIIAPPFNFSALMRLPKMSNILPQCIEAMVTNIDSFGYRLDPIDKNLDILSPEAIKEKSDLMDFLDNPNADESLTKIREKLRIDLETIGNAYIEICRNGLGEVFTINHVPGHTVRLTKQETTPTDITVELPRKGKLVKQKTKKRFRRYMQQVVSKIVYYKEFNDPRPISAITGGVKVDETDTSPEATEIIHLSIYNPESVYGLPRWISQVASINGSYESELTNLQFFKDNAIPALAVLVSGGFLTEEALTNLESYLMAVRGRERVNGVLILEAVGDDESMDDSGKLPVPKIELRPMAGDRQQDAMFQEYDENNQVKVRCSFRLPPIFIGRADDYTKATAYTSILVGENQVFHPERQRFDEVMNHQILATFKPKFWKYASLPAKLVADEERLNGIKTLDSIGAMTPNDARDIGNELFSLKLPRFKEKWADIPFRLSSMFANRGKLKGMDEYAFNDGGAIPNSTQDQQQIADAVDPKTTKPAKKPVKNTKTK